jgi:hypothetical protein
VAPLDPVPDPGELSRHPRANGVAELPLGPRRASARTGEETGGGRGPPPVLGTFDWSAVRRLGCDDLLFRFAERLGRGRDRRVFLAVLVLVARRLGLEAIGRRLCRVVLLATARQHLDVIGDDLGLPVALAAVVVPAPGLDPTLDRDLLTLAEELATGLGEAVPGLTYN